MAKLMGRDPRTMNVTPGYNGQVLLQYRRPDDRTLWRVVCRLGAADAQSGGTLIEWASVREDGSVGRWRTDRQYDERIVVKLDGGTLRVLLTYPDGSTGQASYPLAAVSRNPQVR